MSIPRIIRTVVPLTVALAAAAVAIAPANGELAGLLPDWPSTTSTVGEKATVNGDLLAASTGDTVQLQRKVSGGWVTVDKDAVDDEGSFALDVPTWWLGTREYRLKTQSGILSLPWTGKVIPTYDPRGKRTQHNYQMGSTMARWNPCQAIHWRINKDQATKGALTDTVRALREMTKATGLRFVYEGTTKGIPQFDSNSWYPDDTDLVIAWARRSQSSVFDGYPNADAMGAAYYYSGYQNGNGSDTMLMAKGFVVIDSAKKFKGGFGKGTTRGEVLLHELGHVMGLSHVGATSQSMYPYWTSKTARLGHGDLFALEARGAEMGCITAKTGGSKKLAPPVLMLSQ